jgi:transcriptional regulator with XRE-family HTH domain
MNLSKRLKDIRKSLGKSQEEMAALLEISYPSWQGYELGKSVPGSAVITELIKLGFNSNWILTGEGAMKDDDHERFNITFLTLIIECLDDYETAHNKKLTALDKAEIINYTYELCYEDFGNEKAKELIKDTIKSVEDFFTFIDRLIETKKGQNKAIKMFTKEFGKRLSKEEAEQLAYDLIGSRLVKRKLDYSPTS